jgi:hypothetical protein
MGRTHKLRGHTPLAAASGLVPSQSIASPFRVPRAPESDRMSCDPKRACDLASGGHIREQQDDAAAEHQTLRRRSRAYPSVECAAILRTQRKARQTPSRAGYGISSFWGSASTHRFTLPADEGVSRGDNWHLRGGLGRRRGDRRLLCRELERLLQSGQAKFLRRIIVDQCCMNYGQRLPLPWPKSSAGLRERIRGCRGFAEKSPHSMVPGGRLCRVLAGGRWLASTLTPAASPSGESTPVSTSFAPRPLAHDDDSPADVRFARASSGSSIDRQERSK